MNDFFIYSSIKPWKQLASKVKNAVIFLDNHCAECLHWCGGADLLFEGGATNIKEFSSFESGEKNQEKAVFIISSPLAGKTCMTIEDIVKSSNFNNVLLVATLEPKIHQYASGKENMKDGDTFMVKLKTEICKWMSGINTTAEVIHLPLFMAPMFDNFFVTPAFDLMYPVQRKDLNDLKLQEGEGRPTNLTDLHFYMFPHKYQMLLRMIASSFRQCFHNMGCKEEIFALGPTSHLLSVQLSNLVNQEKKTYSSQIGILFIDRTLDLIGPSSHSNGSLVDQLLSILPGLPAHFNNVSVDVSSLCAANLEDDGDVIYPGCLVADSEENLILSEIYKFESQKAVSHIKECLLKAASDEGLDDDLNLTKSDASPDCIENIVKAFRGNPGAILYNSPLLQLGLATTQMLKDPSYNTIKTLAMTEKLILQQLGDNNPSSIIDQITNIIKSQSEDVVGVDDVFSLLIYASYVFKDHVDYDTVWHKKLVESISSLLSRTPFDEISENFLAAFNLTENTFMDLNALSEAVHNILKSLSQIEINEQQHFHIIKFGSVEPPSYNPLIPQAVERIFAPDKPDIEPDVKHVTTGRKDLLKLGISMFRKITPPRPCDYPVLVIYVIGGITASEVSQVNKVLRKLKSPCKVVIGSSRLISSSDVVDRTLFGNLISDLLG